ncbi:hypothetical protein [Nocardia africana]
MLSSWCFCRRIVVVLNRIECEFAVLRYFVLIGTDRRIHAAQGCGDRRLHLVAQPARPADLGVRCRFKDPATGLLNQRCVTRH